MFVHIGVELFFVVLLIWAMREPQCVEYRRIMFSTLFHAQKSISLIGTCPDTDGPDDYLT